MISNKFIVNNHVDIVGVGYRGGQPKMGVEDGPNAIREGGIAHVLEEQGWKIEDHGNLKFDEFNPQADDRYKQIKWPRTVGKVNETVYNELKKYHEQRHGVLVLGGDHSLAVGSIAASASVHKDLCVIWVDAHADINTPGSSPSGNTHGMPVAFLMGIESKNIPGFEWIANEPPKLPPERIVYIGLRDVDEGEKEILKKLNIKAFSMTEVDRYGISKVMDIALDHLNPNRDRPVHISFDVDGIDPQDVPSTGTPVRGGLSFREARHICERVSETGLLVSMDLVEVNPHLGTEEEKRRTVSTAVDVAKYAFGHSLL